MGLAAQGYRPARVITSGPRLTFVVFRPPGRLSAWFSAREMLRFDSARSAPLQCRFPVRYRPSGGSGLEQPPLPGGFRPTAADFANPPLPRGDSKNSDTTIKYANDCPARHCEERSDEAIKNSRHQAGLLRFAMTSAQYCLRSFPRKRDSRKLLDHEQEAGSPLSRGRADERTIQFGNCKPSLTNTRCTAGRRPMRRACSVQRGKSCAMS